MTQLQESLSNESLFSIAECEQLRKNITLPSTELIELTYNEEKFISKLDELNKIACQMIEDDKYQHASVYLNEAERILEYAAGCGKTIERTVITTILNNQATLLQRTSQFVESANYLEAIIYNINEFIEGCHPFELTPALNNPHSSEYSETGTYLQRKLALALYHLRFCALTSQNKTHQSALASARKALDLLKEICREEDLLQKTKQKSSILVSSPLLSSQNLLSETDTSRAKAILKELTCLKEVNYETVQDFPLFLKKCVSSMVNYNIRIAGSQSSIPSNSNPFENYSIGNLMQASPQQMNLHPSPQEFLSSELSLTGKLFKVVYLSMAHFTVATELRFISVNKYALNEDQRKSCDQFKESRIYHLMSLILISRHLSTRSVFFEHALSSFRNHYGIDLLERMENYEDNEIDKDFSIVISEESCRSQKHSISHIEEVNTYEEDNKSVEIHQDQAAKTNDLASNMLSREHPTPKIAHALMKQIHNQKPQLKRLKLLKSKSKSKPVITTSFSRVLESNKNLNTVTSRNKENKSKSKMMVSKGKQTIKSRRKELKTENDEEDRKGIYYGFTSKSRSKSKRTTIDRKNSKKGLMTKTGLAFQSKKLKNQTKIDQEYGAKSAGTFGVQARPVKLKHIRQSQGPIHEQQNIYLQKSTSPKHVINPIKMKKLKSPSRVAKNEPANKRKSLSKDRYLQ